MTMVSTLEIIYRDPKSLKTRTKNPRIHSLKQIEQIASSIRRFGFISPVLVDTQGAIIVGHARTEAAKLVGLATVPTVQVGHLTAEQVRAYVIADNSLALKAGWDEEMLALELEELSPIFNFDLSFTGFEIPDIDAMLSGDQSQADEESTLDLDSSAAEPPISKKGDLWAIGRHRILCEDSTRIESFATLLGDQRAQMAFTDPPWNVPICGHVSGLGKVKHREFAQASGEMTSPEFTMFLRGAFHNLVQFSADGSIHFVCIDWRGFAEAMDASRGIYSELKNVCVWAKTNAGMGSLYRSQHEFVLVFKSGSASHINNVELGKHGRYRTNLWSYPGMNSFGKDRDADLRLHPTVKPIALVADAILDCSEPGDAILDPFAGSGSTLLAAERVRRRGFGIEIDPQYVDATIARFKKIYGLTAIDCVTGEKFDDRASTVGGGSDAEQ